MFVAWTVGIVAVIGGPALIVRAAVFRRGISVYKSGPFMGRSGIVKLSAVGAGVWGVCAVALGITLLRLAAFGPPLGGAWRAIVLVCGALVAGSLVFLRARPDFTCHPPTPRVSSRR